MRAVLARLFFFQAATFFRLQAKQMLYGWPRCHVIASAS